MMNTNNTSSAPTTKGRRCTWSWPPCQKWMQNNVNRLCASHNTRFNNGERPKRPVDPTSPVAATDTAAANHTTTTTTTTPAHTATPTTKKTKKKMKEKEKKTHKGKRALEKRKKKKEKERLRKREATSRREKGKKAHKAKNAAEKENVKKRDDDDDTDTSTEGRKRRKMGEKAWKKAAKQQSTKKKAARSSSPSSSSSSSLSSSSQSISSSSSSSVYVSSLSSSDKEKRKSGMKQWKKANKKREDNWKGDHKSDDEAQKQRAVVVGQESRAPPESEIIDMLKQIHNHINTSYNQINENIRSMYQLLKDMQGKIDYVVARQNQNVEFNCNASIGGSFNLVDIDDTQEDYGDNSRNGPKVGDANSARLKRGRGLPLRSNSKYKNQEIASRKPKKRKTTEDVGYYKSFPERKQRGEPAANYVGAYAGLKNSNVNCYSNAILQCLASCFCLSDFSPSEEHPEFTLNHAFASLMRSMVGSEKIIDPSPFMSVFMSRFQPMVGEDNEETKTEEGGTYYDFAWTTC